MRNSSRVGWAVGTVVIALGFGGGIGWWLSHQGAGPVITPSQDPAPVAVTPKPAPTSTNPVSPVAEAQTVAESQPTNDDTAAVTPESSGYEEKLEQILLGEGDEKKKAQDILDLMQKTPADEAKVELSQHLINMVQDDNYNGAAELLTNATTTAGVSRVLLNDLLNRGNSLKLPMLLAVAQNDDHPLKDEAKEMLELFIQEDKGTNWSDWKVAIDDWLKTNEPAPSSDTTPAPAQ